MTPPPRVCPHPSADPDPRYHGSRYDCPFWDARSRIQFQQAIQAEAEQRPGLAALVWSDLNRAYRRPSSPPTRPLPLKAEPVTALVSPEPRPSLPLAATPEAHPIRKGAPDA